MDKRAVLFVILSLIILVGWQMLLAPKQQPRQPEPATVEDGQAVEEPYSRDRQAQQEPAVEEPGFDAGELAEPADEVVEATAEEEVRVETDLLKVTLTNRGAAVSSWQFNGYKAKDGNNLEVLPCLEGDEIPLPLLVDVDDPGLAEAINRALYLVEREYLPGDGSLAPGERVTFTWSDGRGLEVRKELTFRKGEYLVEIVLEVTDRGRRMPARITWGPGFDVRDGNVVGGPSSYYAYTGQVAYNIGGRVVRTKQKNVEDGGFDRDVIWAGLEDQYFTALFIPPKGVNSKVRLWTRECLTCPGPGADENEEPGRENLASVSVSVPDEGVLLYVGPKQYTLLRDLGHQLGKSVYFSSYSLLGAIAKWLLLALIWIHGNIIGNFGMAIILTTAALRLVLFPLNQFSMVRMRKTQVEMQRLQPKINGIKAKYKKHKDAESRGKMNKEMMELYQREGVSPMGGMIGCLPMLAQFPILIGFYNMLTVAIELRGAPFYGWIHDLSVKDPYWITPILMGVTMFLQQRLSQTNVTDPTQKQQQRIMMIMPFFFTYICLQMPSGMVLYWFVNNLLGIGQQWLVNRRFNGLQKAKKKA